MITVAKATYCGRKNSRGNAEKKEERELQRKPRSREKSKRNKEKIGGNMGKEDLKYSSSLKIRWHWYLEKRFQ